MGREYRDDGIASHHREDVSAGDDLLAGAFELGFDGIDDVESAQRVVVGTGSLLTREAGGVIQQHRPITPLSFRSKANVMA